MHRLDRRSIDEILLEFGVLSVVQLKKALDLQRKSDKKIEEILLELEYVTEKDIMRANALKMGIDFVDLEKFKIKDKSVPVIVSKNIIQRYKMIPIERTEEILTVAMSDPNNIYAVDDMRLATGLEIKPVLSSLSEIEKLIERYFEGGEMEEPSKKKDLKDTKSTKSTKRSNNTKNTKKAESTKNTKKVKENIAEELLDNELDEEIFFDDLDKNKEFEIEANEEKLELELEESFEVEDSEEELELELEEDFEEDSEEELELELEEDFEEDNEEELELELEEDFEEDNEEELELELEEDFEEDSEEELELELEEDFEEDFEEDNEEELELELEEDFEEDSEEELELELEEDFEEDSEEELELEFEEDSEEELELEFEEENEGELELELEEDFEEDSEEELELEFEEENEEELELELEEDNEEEELGEDEDFELDLEKDFELDLDEYLDDLDEDLEGIGNSKESQELLEDEFLQEDYFSNETSPSLESILDDNEENEENLPNTKGNLFKVRLGDLLVENKVITEENLKEALEEQRESGQLLGKILMEKGYITQEELYKLLEKQLGVKYIDLRDIEISQELISLVSENIARRYKLIPIKREGDTLTVAMSDPVDIFSIDDVRFATGMKITPLLSDQDLIDEALDKYYNKVFDPLEEEKKRHEKFEEEIKAVNEKIAVELNDEEKKTTKGDKQKDIVDVDDAPIVKMLNIILYRAIDNGASDIHIEPQEDGVVVRNRIDGQLVEVTKHDKKVILALVARLKIISGLNIAEKRIPQDGRVSMNINGKDYDMRISVLPTMFGEKAVIRIASKEGFNVNKEKLGFFKDDLMKFDDILKNPHGIILVTGPTGSGKSTTLYTALRELAQPNINIMTVEDPVELTIKGINQVQVNTKAGLTFAHALRAFLRQDPDIIMVGEIRDGETAEIAARAAITGHLVLSTLHTNDAASSVTRMIDMGIEPFMMSSSIVGVIAQRLVRKLCTECKKEVIANVKTREILKISGDKEAKIYEHVGCDECNNTGYKGRVAVYEIMTINRELRELIAKNVNSDTIKEVAIKSGMVTLRENCSRLVKAGMTSVEELLRISYSAE